nr:transposase [Ferrimicrobium acidiphilum]
MGEGRKKETLAVFGSLSLERRAAIEVVALDLWDPFLASIGEYVLGDKEKLVCDRFHIMEHTNAGGTRSARGGTGNSGRKATRRGRGASISGSTEGRTSQQRNGTVSPFSKRPTSRPGEPPRRRRFGRSSGITRASAEGGNTGGGWHFWATHSRVEPIKRRGTMIKDHPAGGMNYFAQRITNAGGEGLNSKIATIQKMAYWFRNKNHFRSAVRFRCGGLCSTRRPLTTIPDGPKLLDGQFHLVGIGLPVDAAIWV